MPGYGTVFVDIAFGGAFYALCRVEQLRRIGSGEGGALSIETSSVSTLLHAANAVFDAVQLMLRSGTLCLRHPEGKTALEFLYGAILTDERAPDDDAGTSTFPEPTYNFCRFGDGQVDRSPTGSGVSARLATMWHKKQVGVSERRAFRSFLGSEFHGGVEVVEKNAVCFPATDVASECTRDAVRLRISGQAYYTGTQTLTTESGDSLMDGFRVRS